MFDLYLTGAEMTFRRLGHMVWQLQIARGHEAVPLTRDYMLNAELAPSNAARSARTTVPPTLSRDTR